jgi:hypothetical protein
MKRNILRVGLALAAGTAVLAPAAMAAPAANGGVQVLAVYGDAPYGTTPTDTVEFGKSAAFIDTVNADPDVTTVLHVGDIHSGKQYCTEPYDRSVYDLWQRFQDPLVYTPGDNEWSDCHKVAEGGGLYNATTHQIDYVQVNGANPDYAKGDPARNLDLVRRIFFSRPGVSLGRHSMHVDSQARNAIGPDAHYVENVMWQNKQTLFVTINLPGGSNNDADVWYGAPTATAAQNRERAERTRADIDWINKAFDTARHHAGIANVVIEAQADMWDSTDTPAHETNYEPIVAAIAHGAKAFGKPTLMLNGDSHTYETGNPLTPGNTYHPGYDVPNFERIVVHGSTLPLEWLKLTIDPKANAARSDTAFGPFRWERKIQSQL